MTDGVIRFDNISAIDKTLYYQCREYIKLCLMIEDLQCFEELDGSYTYQKLIDETIFKSSVLLREFDSSLKRLKNKKDESEREDVIKIGFNNIIKEAIKPRCPYCGSKLTDYWFYGLVSYYVWEKFQICSKCKNVVIKEKSGERMREKEDNEIILFPDSEDFLEFMKKLQEAYNNEGEQG